MSETEQLQPPGEKMRKVLCWVAEILEQHPEKKRQEVLREAEIRFDLSPAECEFLDRNFSRGCDQER